MGGPSCCTPGRRHRARDAGTDDPETSAAPFPRGDDQAPEARTGGSRRAGPRARRRTRRRDPSSGTSGQGICSDSSRISGTLDG